jgi:hypothetical protein
MTNRGRWRAVLWVEVASYQHIGVVQARGKHADAHLAAAGRRYRGADHLQSVGIPEAIDLNNLVARLRQGCD